MAILLSGERAYGEKVGKSMYLRQPETRHRLMQRGTDHSENASAITRVPRKKIIAQFGCISESRNCVNV